MCVSRAVGKEGGETYPCCAGTKGLRAAQRTVDVLGEDRGRKTVHGVVRLVDDVLVVVELDHDADGAEDLLLDDAHVLLRVREDRGLDEVALVAPALATELHRGTLLLARVDELHDTLQSGLVREVL